MTRRMPLGDKSIQDRLTQIMVLLWPVVEASDSDGSDPVLHAYDELMTLRCDVYNGVFDPHVEGPFTCRACGHQGRSVVPADGGIVDLECPHCSVMACDGDDDDA